MYSTLPVGSIFYLTFLYFCLSYQQQQHHRSGIQANNTFMVKLTISQNPIGRGQMNEFLWDSACCFSFLLEKTRTSNHFQMSEQRKHNLLSNLKPLAKRSDENPAWTRHPEYRKESSWVSNGYQLAIHVPPSKKKLRKKNKQTNNKKIKLNKVTKKTLCDVLPPYWQ